MLSKGGRSFLPKKSVLVINTGGTMGMGRNSEGTLEPIKGYLTQQILQMPEIQQPEMPRVTVIEYDPLLDSSAMGPKSWGTIVSDIEKCYNNYDGFVVVMGTDTMHFAASAVSFMLKNLGKSVVFTGSIIPFAEVYSDARRNLIMSLIFSVSSSFQEVCICFGDRLLRANRAIKVDSTGLGAFQSPNFPPLATLGVSLPQPTMSSSPLHIHI